MRNQVQLITYADRLAGSLGGLAEMLTDGPLAGLFGGVHILPFFPPYDGADAGFDPIDQREVDPRLGSWDDVRAIAAGHDVVADLIVNHLSAAGPWFQDVRARGDASPYASMFLTFGDVFPDGATEADLVGIYRPRPGLPFTRIRLGDADRLVWTTFTGQQIDLNVRDPKTWHYLQESLRAFAAAGIDVVRVDAAGYAIKTPGTSCFMTPDTYLFLDQLTAQAEAVGLQVLLEIHAYYRQQVQIATRVHWVYDFGLPPLVLHALLIGDARPLLHWLAVRPVNCVTVLDTHDGIGLVDAGPDAAIADRDAVRPGLLRPDQIATLVEAVHTASGGGSRLATGTAASNVDIYQVNCTFYDALGADDRRYLLARMIQLMAPGIPQIYYVGLLAGRNDLDLLARTGVGRDVNRHYLKDAADVARACEQPVVRALLSVIRLRNGHPAFAGRFDCGAGPVDPGAGPVDPGAGPVDPGLGGRDPERGAGRLWMEWTAGPERVRLEADTESASWSLTWTADGDARSSDTVSALVGW